MHIGQTEEWEKKLERHQLGSPFRKVEYPEQKSLNRHKRSSDRYQTVILLSLEIKAGSEVLWLPLLHWQHEEYRTPDTCAELHKVTVAQQKAELQPPFRGQNNCLGARPHHRWLTWASCFSQGTEPLKFFCNIQNINKPWPCPHCVFSRAWQQGRQLLHCLSRDCAQKN